MSEELDEAIKRALEKVIPVNGLDKLKEVDKNASIALNAGLSSGIVSQEIVDEAEAKYRKKQAQLALGMVNLAGEKGLNSQEREDLKYGIRHDLIGAKDLTNAQDTFEKYRQRESQVQSQ